MSSSTDIAAVYHEFTEALTEVLAENAVGVARRGRLARAHAAVKKHPGYSEPGYILAVEMAFTNWEAIQNIGRCQGDEKVTPLTRPKAGCAQDTLLCLADIARRRTTTPSLIWEGWLRNLGPRKVAKATQGVPAVPVPLQP